MKANIRTIDGLQKNEILEKPFRIKSKWFFVLQNEYSIYVITEWSTGCRFASAVRKEGIRPRINYIIKKLGIEKINQQIKETIKKHGIANEGMPEDEG